jgi:uncharacterized protein YbaA (DUF1428 family)
VLLAIDRLGSYPAAAVVRGPLHAAIVAPMIRAGESGQYKNITKKEDHMAYVDGFVVPVPTRKLDAYRRMSRKAGKLWREHGALEYKECVADDAPKGKVTSFPQSVKLKKGETVVFSWITYRSRAHRDSVNKKVMADPRLEAMMDPKNMPFDGQRMIYGGFKVAVEV